MLAHSFDRFYVVIKFILPTITDLKFSLIKLDEKCEYLQEEKGCSSKAKQYILDLIIHCRKIRPFVHYYREQITSFNPTAHKILKNEIELILPQSSTVRKEKRGIIASLISVLIGLEYESISSFLHN